jgi:hypothetical protein
VFLLSARADGVGINHTGSQIIIIFDSDMNPQGDVQVRKTLSRLSFCTHFLSLLSIALTSLTSNSSFCNNAS